MSGLSTSLIDGELRLELFGETHVDDFQRAVSQDGDIWEIYPVDLRDPQAQAELCNFHGSDGWVRYAAMVEDRVIGTTSYMNPDLKNGTVMIGATYLEPAARGTGINRRLKRLMIDHAFAQGFWRIEFTVDTRNRMSMRAMEKMGAKLEGIMRRNRVTWTGYVRDTALFSILREEWAG